MCQKCYGWDLGRNALVELGTPVGIVAAQSIGEPGTQLTMRTFHAGGVAGSADITQGLPRVQELFEAQSPKGEAIIAEIGGKVTVREEGDKHLIRIQAEQPGKDYYDIRHATLPARIKNGVKVKAGQLLFTNVEGDDIHAKREGIVRLNEKEKKMTVEGVKADIWEVEVPGEVALWVRDGDVVQPGQQITEGHINVQRLYKVAGPLEVARYIIREAQAVYAIQGETIHDKHLEIIVRQMLSRVRVLYGGDTSLLPGRIYEVAEFEEENERVLKEKGEPAMGERLLLGITRVSLTTSSFLAAAAFQETARVLIDAAVTGREDHLRGLKENVIIGKLIPVGTGFRLPAQGQT